MVKAVVVCARLGCMEENSRQRASLTNVSAAEPPKTYRKGRLPNAHAPAHEVIPSQNTEVPEIAAAGSSGKCRLHELVPRAVITEPGGPVLHAQGRRAS